MTEDEFPVENEVVEPTKEEKPQKANGQDLQVVDPRGYTICLQMETWNCHITAGHPEVKDKLELVTKTLASPQIIIRKTKGVSTAWFYYRLTGRVFYRTNDIYMSVVVDLDESTKTGSVKTAYLVKDIKKGDLIWMQRN